MSSAQCWEVQQATVVSWAPADAFVVAITAAELVGWKVKITTDKISYQCGSTNSAHGTSRHICLEKIKPCASPRGWSGRLNHVMSTARGNLRWCEELWDLCSLYFSESHKEARTVGLARGYLQDTLEYLRYIASSTRDESWRKKSRIGSCTTCSFLHLSEGVLAWQRTEHSRPTSPTPETRSTRRKTFAMMSSP